MLYVTGMRPSKVLIKAEKIEIEALVIGYLAYTGVGELVSDRRSVL